MQLQKSEAIRFTGDIAEAAERLDRENQDLHEQVGACAGLIENARSKIDHNRRSHGFVMNDRSQ